LWGRRRVSYRPEGREKKNVELVCGGALCFANGGGTRGKEKRQKVESWGGVRRRRRKTGKVIGHKRGQWVLTRKATKKGSIGNSQV